MERREGPVAQPEWRVADHAGRADRPRPLQGEAGGGRGRGAPTARAGRAVARSPEPADVAARRRVRPRLPRPQRGAAQAGRRAPTARPRRADLPGPVRPHPAAVDVLRDRRRGRWRHRDGVEDPPHRGRRHRRRTPGRGVPPADRQLRRPARDRSRCASSRMPSRAAGRESSPRRRRRSVGRRRATRSATPPGVRPASSVGWRARWRCGGPTRCAPATPPTASSTRCAGWRARSASPLSPGSRRR